MFYAGYHRDITTAVHTMGLPPSFSVLTPPPRLTGEGKETPPERPPVVLVICVVRVEDGINHIVSIRRQVQGVAINIKMRLRQ